LLTSGQGLQLRLRRVRRPRRCGARDGDFERPPCSPVGMFGRRCCGKKIQIVDTNRSCLGNSRQLGLSVQ
jgi:hypothetical protein